VIVPSLSRCNFITFPFTVCLLHVRFFVLLIEVLRHKIKNSVDALLRIVLSVALECDVVLAEDSLEQVWPYHLALTFPHF
jgi:hypothetical protein